jgi:hypothetical protein
MYMKGGGLPLNPVSLSEQGDDMNLPTRRAHKALALREEGATLDDIRKEITAYSKKSDAAIQGILTRVALRDGLELPRRRNAKRERDLEALRMIGSGFTLEEVMVLVPALNTYDPGYVKKALLSRAKKEGLPEPEIRRAPKFPTRRAHKALALREEGATLDEIRAEIPAYVELSDAAIQGILKRVALRDGLQPPPRRNLVRERDLEALRILGAGFTLEETLVIVPALQAYDPGYVKKALLTRAKKEGLPEPEIRRAPKYGPVQWVPPRDHSLKKRAYELRSQGFSWEHIALELGQEPGPKGRDLVRVWARRWAKMNDLPAPPARIAERTRARLAYKMRVVGSSRADVAAATGYTEAGGLAAADCHAQREGLPLPPRKEVRDLRGIWAWATENSTSKEEVAEKFGFASGRDAGTSLLSWCKRTGEAYPWELANRGTLTEGRAEAAYKAHSEGNSWSEVARLLGYSSGGSAMSVARKWARNAGKPWPPEPALFTCPPYHAHS